MGRSVVQKLLVVWALWQFTLFATSQSSHRFSLPVLGPIALSLGTCKLPSATWTQWPEGGCAQQKLQTPSVFPKVLSHYFPMFFSYSLISWHNVCLYFFFVRVCTKVKRYFKKTEVSEGTIDSFQMVCDFKSRWEHYLDPLPNELETEPSLDWNRSGRKWGREKNKNGV